MQQPFIYNEAFSRNIGWLTREEQNRLQQKRVAIAGLGGVGGLHLLTLCRLGIGKFHLAEFDTFDLANFNRQIGANIETIGLSKLDVMIREALKINPDLEISRFPDGINEGNSEAFLADVDIYIDGLDFFAFNARQHIFASCAAKNIPAVTAAPLGMGTAVLNFMPRGMTFEDYFGLKNSLEEEKGLRFFIGLAPARLQMSYLVDPTTIDLVNRKGPSTIMACQLCAGAAATEALKILLGRGPIRVAPKGYHFDAYLNKLAFTWRPWGNRNPLSRLAISLAHRKLKHA
ncbi:Molybdopterin or thiamine biosynthesis adenylyltransferase [Nitrosomonas eutropha]|uniref:ThiF family adenylyltransferase n=1 Tax=Nitrosomonas TaxID=914 RepID=UPI000885134C|nr:MULTISPECIES: ThiF family adenylyltransferase [Nitrosomonas]MXS79796.1 ThiF family adenylyltransferase [Nitrosomonas sp. GH22]SCX05045.1 Molybdopterin or thiamine biosynthesis adenylyltransferase [Nitrosomonas eutropha]SDW47195.1 Molybdopterin or thiamine biosynthesis adenylyltransferase [Nitrosomonas eutropha]